MDASAVVAIVAAGQVVLLGVIGLQKLIVKKLAEKGEIPTSDKIKSVCDERFTRLFYWADKSDKQIEKLNSDIKSQMMTLALNSGEIRTEIEFMKKDNEKFVKRFEQFCDKIECRLNDSGKHYTALQTQLNTIRSKKNGE